MPDWRKRAAVGFGLVLVGLLVATSGVATGSAEGQKDLVPAALAWIGLLVGLIGVVLVVASAGTDESRA